MLARVDENDDTDAGPRRNAAATERLCIATREVKPVADLMRFVVAPDGSVVADLKRNLPGRGVWVTARRAIVAEAVRRKAFARGFRRDVRVAPDLPAQIEQMLERAALDALAIAHKGGQVVTGFSKVEAALEHGKAVALLHAAEASRDGIRKLGAALRRGAGDADRLPVIEAFTSPQLDLALGRPNVVHAALLAGPASNSFLARCRNLERFRMAEPSAQG
jgi:predicted RNA-binding protein YlxR (DUF448 family)